MPFSVTLAVSHDDRQKQIEAAALQVMTASDGDGQKHREASEH